MNIIIPIIVVFIIFGIALVVSCVWANLITSAMKDGNYMDDNF